LAFGDDSMLCEKYLHPSRHIEVQILGDGKGRAVALGERECSIQRRHQKVLEESPSPAVDTDLRRELERAAVSLASAVRYRNAGTVEFLLDEARNFYFLEVNTRLQVEHPVTELVRGLDLVHLQLDLAAGLDCIEALRRSQDGLAKRPLGHALEARICAEDPTQDHLPVAGRIRVCVEPTGPGIRVDSGVFRGSEVSAHYDSLIAKVIVHGADRSACLDRMGLALSRAAWLGLPTNVDYLLRVVRHPAFRAGDLRTDFLELHDAELRQDGRVPEEALLAAALAPAFLGDGPGGPRSLEREPPSPWRARDRFRLGEA
ncbi:MAG: hypothetical protein ACE5F1_22025, partial [Planctomycetota bacterium]